MAGVIATGERLFQSRGLNINWFPGHMSSATKAIRERIKMVDMVIEVRDARIPLTSACAHLEELMQVPTHALRPRAALPRTTSGCTCLSWPVSRAGPLGPRAESPPPPRAQRKRRVIVLNKSDLIDPSDKVSLSPTYPQPAAPAAAGAAR
jgi:hypothetical protein